MNKLNVFFNKKKKFFKVSLNRSSLLFNLNMVNVKSKNLSTPTYNFMLILRVLTRCGFVKPIKKF